MRIVQQVQQTSAVACACTRHVALHAPMHAMTRLIHFKVASAKSKENCGFRPEGNLMGGRQPGARSAMPAPFLAAVRSAVPKRAGLLSELPTSLLPSASPPIHRTPVITTPIDSVALDYSIASRGIDFDLAVSFAVPKRAGLLSKLPASRLPSASPPVHRMPVITPYIDRMAPVSRQRDTLPFSSSMQLLCCLLHSPTARRTHCPVNMR